MTTPKITYKPRCCHWCGAEFQPKSAARLYCSQKCKDDFGNFMLVVGKRIAPVAMKWRAARGGKDNGGSAAFHDLCKLLDQANEEFRDARPKGAPTIHQYLAARNGSSQIRSGLDRR